MAPPGLPWGRGPRTGAVACKQQRIYKGLGLWTEPGLRHEGALAALTPDNAVRHGCPQTKRPARGGQRGFNVCDMGARMACHEPSALRAGPIPTVGCSPIRSWSRMQNIKCCQESCGEAIRPSNSRRNGSLNGRRRRGERTNERRRAGTFGPNKRKPHHDQSDHPGARRRRMPGHQAGDDVPMPAR